jgi:hypothetical protein
MYAHVCVLYQQHGELPLDNLATVDHYTLDDGVVSDVVSDVSDNAVLQSMTVSAVLQLVRDMHAHDFLTKEFELWYTAFIEQRRYPIPPSLSNTRKALDMWSDHYTAQRRSSRVELVDLAAHMFQLAVDGNSSGSSGSSRRNGVHTDVDRLHTVWRRSMHSRAARARRLLQQVCTTVCNGFQRFHI